MYCKVLPVDRFNCLEHPLTRFLLQDWACEDFNLFDFIGQDEQSHSTADDYSQQYGQQKDDFNNLQKPDLM